MNRIILVLPTKLKYKVSTRAKLFIETIACTHTSIRDVRWTEQVFLLQNTIHRAQVIQPGDTKEALRGGVIYMKTSKQVHAGTI